MWKIGDLKRRGRTMMKMNYWRTVLVALLLAIIVGAGTAASGSSSATNIFRNRINQNDSVQSYDYPDIDDSFTIGGGSIYDDSYDEAFNYSITTDELGEVFGFVMVATLLILVILLILLILSIVLDVLIFNPFEVGARRFFYRNLYEKGEVKEVAYSFDHNYKNVVKVMFFRDLYELLWSLLLVIPGIVKSYEYAMIPYLLGEYPDMPQEDAFAISRYMMDGNKFKAFLLDLSFIGWRLLSVIPLVGMLYVDPYYNMTHAALYDTLKETKRPFASTEETNPFDETDGFTGYHTPEDNYVSPESSDPNVF